MNAAYENRAHDFRLRPGSGAVDAGCRLPNVNDGFAGSAPDLGALESEAHCRSMGQEINPRTEGWEPASGRRSD